MKFNFRRSRKSVKLAELPQSSGLQPKPKPLYLKLRKHQRTALKFALGQPGTAMILAPRMGKTWVAMALIEQDEPSESLLVVPLTNKLSTWRRLLLRHLPQYAVCLTLEEYRKESFPKIYLTHYEAIPAEIKKLRKIKWGLVCYDEAQRLKGRSTGQSRHAMKFDYVPRRLALSGTPIDGEELEMFGLMRFVDSRALGKRWTDFDHHFLVSGGFMGKEKSFKESERKLFEQRLRPFVLCMTREEADIAEARIINRPVIMLDAQRAHYDEMSDDWLTEINGAGVSSKLEITKRVKLQQITSGFITDDESVLHRIKGAKERELRKLLLDHIEPPAVIFCQYLQDVELCEKICREFSDSVAILTGAVKDKPRSKNRTNLLQSFQRGEIDYLVAQQKTGGVGVDMYRARNAVVYSHTESWIDFDQMRSRMDYPDLPAARIYLIFCKNTIDNLKRIAVMSKQSISEVLLMKLKPGEKP